MSAEEASAGGCGAELQSVGKAAGEQGEIVTFTWEYVGIGEKVQVADKVYSDCLKVRITARTIDYPVDPVTIHRYYARGVGLVKTEWPDSTPHILRDYRIQE